MKYLEYVKSKHNLLIIWFCFHGFALFVNIFQVQGNIGSDNNKIYLLTAGKQNYPFLFDGGTNQFWPFVTYTTSFNRFNYSNYPDIYIEKDFLGIFFRYDISEFIFYSVLIFLILYIKWNYKNSPKRKNMQKLTEQQAEKVISKYLPIIKAKFTTDNKVDIGINSPAGLGDKCFVYAITSNDEMQNLDIFCKKYDIEYDITDCL